VEKQIGDEFLKPKNFFCELANPDTLVPNTICKIADKTRAIAYFDAFSGTAIILLYGFLIFKMIKSSKKVDLTHLSLITCSALMGVCLLFYSLILFKTIGKPKFYLERLLNKFYNDDPKTKEHGCYI
jgi:ATP/ADP translocase